MTTIAYQQLRLLPILIFWVLDSASALSLETRNSADKKQKHVGVHLHHGNTKHAHNTQKHGREKEVHRGAKVKHGSTRSQSRDHSKKLKRGERGEYYWPHGRGRVGSFGASEERGTPDLQQSPSWSWHHPDGRFHTTIVGSPLIDHSFNIYLAAEDGVRKFDRNGSMLWLYKAPGPIGMSPSLFKGSLFGSTRNGHIFAVDMETGNSKWVINVSVPVADGAGFVEAHNSVVVAAVDSVDDGGNSRVIGLSASTGELLWDFRPDYPVYNFAPFFGPDRTVVFQDGNAGLYRIGIDHGKIFWSKPGQELVAPQEEDGDPPGGIQASHTEGGVVLGSNGIVYSVSVWATSKGTRSDTPGGVHAYNVSDGSLLWYRQMPRPPNSIPAIARLTKNKKAGFSLVVPMGKPLALPVVEYMPWWMPKEWKLAFHKESIALGEDANRLWHNKRMPTELLTMDAETGEAGWTYEAPLWSHITGAGDEEGLLERRRLGIRETCQPPPWSSPIVDSEGTVYVGHESGKFFAIRDKNHDGHINRKHEVSVFDAGAGFLQPPSLAPGMLAVASCDSLFVFLDEGAGRADAQ